MDYEQPVTVPFETWGTSAERNIDESFDLARYLDPKDDYDDDSYFSSVDIAAIDDMGEEKSVDHYIDKENEVIQMIVSLHNLLKNTDPCAMHLFKGRDIEKDEEYFSSLLGNAEKSTMDLYNLKSELRPTDINESVRMFVRRVLKENYQLPKGQWLLLQPGDPLRDAVKLDLFDLVQTTYEPIGGHFKISSPDSLERYNFWIVQDLDDDPEVDVAIMGKPDIAGNKMGAAANDGSGAASSAYKNKSADLRAGGEVSGVGNWWGEVSGKPAYAMIKRGAKAVSDEAKVAELLAGDNFEFHGEHPDPNAPALFKSVTGWYTKKFGDKSSTKIILGNPL
jgi:hypothetical protein